MANSAFRMCPPAEYFRDSPSTYCKKESREPDVKEVLYRMSVLTGALLTDLFLMCVYLIVLPCLSSKSHVDTILGIYHTPVKTSPTDGQVRSRA